MCFLFPKVVSVILFFVPGILSEGFAYDLCQPSECCEHGASIPYWNPTTNKGDCTKFKICVNMEWMDVECAGGLLFDKVSLRCDHEHVVTENKKCLEDYTCMVGTTTESCLKFSTPAYPAGDFCPGIPKDICCGSNLTLPNKTSCLHYLRCVHGCETQNMRCSNGTLFSAETGTCDHVGRNFDCSYRCVTSPAPVTATTIPTRTPDFLTKGPPLSMEEISFVIIATGFIIVIFLLMIIFYFIHKMCQTNRKTSM